MSIVFFLFKTSNKNLYKALIVILWCEKINVDKKYTKKCYLCKK